MTPEIKNCATWEEAHRWLARHGWGLGLIEEQKVLWDAANTLAPLKIKSEPVAINVEPEAASKPAVKTAVKPVAKATE
jgi:hypothetical protein